MQYSKVKETEKERQSRLSSLSSRLKQSVLNPHESPMNVDIAKPPVGVEADRKRVHRLALKLKKEATERRDKYDLHNDSP